MTAPSPGIEPKRLAELLVASSAADYADVTPEERRLAAARVLDFVRRHLEPLPPGPVLVARVVSLGAGALGLVLLMTDLARHNDTVGEALAARWSAAVEALTQRHGLSDSDAAAVAFELVFGRIAREAAASMSAADAVTEPSRAEWLVRRVAGVVGLATRLGGRAEPDTRRAQALERLDPAAAVEAAHRLAYDQRYARVLDQLLQELQGGAKLAGAATYRHRP